MTKPSRPAISIRSAPTGSPSNCRDAHARTATSARLAASAATVKTIPFTGDDRADQELAPRSGSGGCQEAGLPSAAVICWIASASAGLTACPCSLWAAATLLARVITKRR